MHPTAAVGKFDVHERVGHRARKSVDPHLSAAQRLRTAQTPRLDCRVAGQSVPQQASLRSVWLDQGRVEGKPSVPEHWRLEQDAEVSALLLVQFEVSGSNLVGMRDCGGQPAEDMSTQVLAAG